MICKPFSWLAAAVFFLFMVVCYLGFSALLPPVRHQMASIHSIYWHFELPWSLACCAVLALAARLIPALALQLRTKRATRAS
jgi:hypothetical protein